VHTARKYVKALSSTCEHIHLLHTTQVAEHPLPLAPDTDADAWLVALASSPLSEVQDPRRSSVPSAAAAAAALQGKREVSPRWVGPCWVAVLARVAL
jgi:hypothetical protein